MNVGVKVRGERFKLEVAILKGLRLKWQSWRERSRSQVRRSKGKG